MAIEKRKSGVYTLSDFDQKQQPPVLPASTQHGSVPTPAPVPVAPQTSAASYAAIVGSIAGDVKAGDRGDFDIDARGPGAHTKVGDITVGDDAKFEQKAYDQGHAIAGKVEAGKNFKFKMNVDSRPLQPEQPKSSSTPSPSRS